MQILEKTGHGSWQWPVRLQDMTDPINLAPIGAALAVGLTGMGAAWAEKDIGAATVGAMAEKEGLFGKGLTLMVLPESIAILGFAIAFFLYQTI